MLKFNNHDKTSATFNGVSFALDGAENWQSIGDGPTRDAVLAWLAEGRTPELADVPVAVVPASVTMRQARLALLHAGLLGSVNAAIAAMPGAAGDAARIEWEYSQEVQRNKALVLALAPVLSLNDAQLDALFVTAAAL